MRLAVDELEDVAVRVLDAQLHLRAAELILGH